MSKTLSKRDGLTGDMIFSISRAAEYVGVFALTLRNWEKKGKIKVFRTPGGHRRFRRSDLDILMGVESKKCVKLKNTIRDLEAISLSEENYKELNKFIEELKDIAEEL